MNKNMAEFYQQIEDGKEVLRGAGINFSSFRETVSGLLVNPGKLSEDEWVNFYNVYAGSVGRVAFESVTDWAEDFFEEFNEEEHGVYLKSKKTK